MASCGSNTSPGKRGNNRVGQKNAKRMKTNIAPTTFEAELASVSGVIDILAKSKIKEAATKILEFAVGNRPAEVGGYKQVFEFCKGPNGNEFLQIFGKQLHGSEDCRAFKLNYICHARNAAVHPSHLHQLESLVAEAKAMLDMRPSLK